MKESIRREKGEKEPRLERNPVMSGFGPEKTTRPGEKNKPRKEIWDRKENGHVEKGQAVEADPKLYSSYDYKIISELFLRGKG